MMPIMVYLLNPDRSKTTIETGAKERSKWQKSRQRIKSSSQPGNIRNAIVSLLNAQNIALQIASWSKYLCKKVQLVLAFIFLEKVKDYIITTHTLQYPISNIQLHQGESFTEKQNCHVLVAINNSVVFVWKGLNTF